MVEVVDRGIPQDQRVREKHNFGNGDVDIIRVTPTPQERAKYSTGELKPPLLFVQGHMQDAALKGRLESFATTGRDAFGVAYMGPRASYDARLRRDKRIGANVAPYQLGKEKDVIEAMVKFGITQSDILATSEGAMRALIAVARHPDRFRNVLFVHPAAMDKKGSIKTHVRVASHYLREALRHPVDTIRKISPKKERQEEEANSNTKKRKLIEKLFTDRTEQLTVARTQFHELAQAVAEKNPHLRITIIGDEGDKIYPPQRFEEVFKESKVKVIRSNWGGHGIPPGQEGIKQLETYLTEMEESRATDTGEVSTATMFFEGSSEKSSPPPRRSKTWRRVRGLIRLRHHLRELQAHDKWTREELLSHQERALVALRNYALDHAPFYQEFHRGLEDAPLSALPILTKKIVMANFDRLVTDPTIRLEEVQKHVEQGSIGPFHGKYEVVATSGTTGTPGIFIYDSKEWATIMASLGRTLEWADLKPALRDRPKIAIVSSTNDKNISARAGKSANNPLLPTFRIDATEPVSDIVERLNNEKPTALVAYAGMAYLLAQEQEAGRLHITPNQIITVSEVLTPQMRKTIEAVWGPNIFNEYGATEVGTIASEDKSHQGMRIFEDLVIVENVDKDGNPVPDGQFGDRILITTLFSRTQPLIRYEISDSVRFVAGKPAGPLPYQAIAEVQGRSGDILTIEGTSVHPKFFRDVMEVIPNNGWQIVQEENGLRVLLVTPQMAVGDVERQIKHALTQQGIHNTPITVDLVDAIPQAKSGKTPLVRAYHSDEIESTS